MCTLVHTPPAGKSIDTKRFLGVRRCSCPSFPFRKAVLFFAPRFIKRETACIFIGNIASRRTKPSPRGFVVSRTQFPTFSVVAHPAHRTQLSVSTSPPRPSLFINNGTHEHMWGRAMFCAMLFVVGFGLPCSRDAQGGPKRTGIGLCRTWGQQISRPR